MAQELLTLEAPPADAVLAIIAQASRDPQVDVAKLQILLEMRERVMAKEAETAFAMAMKLAQAEMPAVVRDADNPHTKSRYARLETIDAAIRPIYTNHGFSLTFDSPMSEADGVTVSCLVLHDRGHSKPYRLKGALDTTGAKGTSNKTDIQGLGSALSYLRRYLTVMIFNVALANEDNDGNGRGPQVITKEQVDSVWNMLNSLDIKVDTGEMGSFLAWAGAPKVAEIRVSDYRRIMQGLTAKLEKKQGRK